MTTDARKIKVPADAVRTREEILADAVIANGAVWVRCHNCGGTGDYPSSMTPPGRCRFYCWENRTPETFGRLPLDIDKYVKREQAHDRREYRRPIIEERRRAQMELRAQNPDPRIAALATAAGFSFSDPEKSAASQVAARSRDTALSLIRQWCNRGELTDAQWELVDKLPTWIAEQEQEIADVAARKAKSQYVGTIGDRVEISITVDRCATFESAWGGGYVYTLVDEAGNAFVWFTSNAALDEDESYTLRGTIKDHKEYDGQRQTVVTRCKVIGGK